MLIRFVDYQLRIRLESSPVLTHNPFLVNAEHELYQVGCCFRAVDRAMLPATRKIRVMVRMSVSQEVRFDARYGGVSKCIDGDRKSSHDLWSEDEVRWV